MTETTVKPNVEFGALIGKGVMLIILGVLMLILYNSSIIGAIAATQIPAMILSIFIIFFGIALLCGGTSFGKSGIATVVLGILIIILGIVFLINPFVTAEVMICFIAAAALVGGIFNLVNGIVGVGDANRVLTIVVGILGILVGAVILVMVFAFSAYLTAMIFAYIMAIFMVVYGIISIIQAILLKAGQKKAVTA